MHLKPLNLKRSINKAYLKEKVGRTDIELFKKNFADLLNKIDSKGDEEHLKSLVADFLKFTWYKDAYQINPIGKNDLVIHTGKSPADPIAVIIEVKRPGNTGEMISEGKLNAKALHELILYYLHERVVNNRHELKQLIATDIFKWYIFDANEFDKKIYRNSAIKRLYEQKRQDNKDNPWFYDQLSSLLRDIDISLEATVFDINDLKKYVLNANNDDDHKLIPLFKGLSPVHLLKLSFANDSNTLQPKFYSELLHIIGLHEYKEGSKKLISRKKEGERDRGSLLENVITNLDSHDKISRLDKPSQYGETYQERTYNVALELVITWINRILFLKLLEAQLLNYHKRDKSYTFLNKDKIKDYDDLDKLFFRVLAKRVDERSNDINELFGKVPYLNSSLFEPTDLEHQTLFINTLEDNIPLALISSTVLKDQRGKTLKGKLNALDYLFDFLNAYDFSSEGAEEIQEDNKTLINASVLGLIFEKINGYKDGSFFTPGFITMYMCRETIRRSVVQKFNEAKGWELKEYAELYDRIEDKAEANQIINSIKICDPAVGSGHFLVSALNEMIAIKSDLNILMSADGRTLRDHNVEVVNDELIITNDDGDPFTYNYKDLRSQTVQHTLFHEKQTIIENCLFGVDINPNSVKICRLRLWIELLKNAYYRADAKGYLQLETLPNIDINIKTGNSLISRYTLDADLKQALRKKKITIEEYRNVVRTYRNARDKEQKWQMENIINSIKTNFRSEISSESKELARLEREFIHKYGSEQLFDNKLNRTQLKYKKNLKEKIELLQTKIEDIKSNKIYQNAFEWRFEFPEVLNDDGDFLGFDVVIGNPPYGVEISSVYKSYFSSKFLPLKGEVEIYCYFIELAVESLLNSTGHFSFITTNTIYYLEKFASVRRDIFLKNSIIALIELEKQVFSDAPDIVPAVYVLRKGLINDNRVELYKSSKTKKVYDLITFSDFFAETLPQFLFEKKQSYILNVTSNQGTERVIEKLASLNQIKDYYKVLYGIKTGNNDKFLNQTPGEGNWKKCTSSANNISKYHIHWKGDWLNVSKDLVGLSNVNYEQPKILIQYIRKISMPVRLVCALDSVGEYYPLNNFSFIISDKGYSLFLLLGIINSKLINWYFSNCYIDYNIKPKYLERLPLPENLSFSKIDELVVELLNGHKDSNFLENQIDQLVYQLYNLTEEEIKIVEGNAN